MADEQDVPDIYADSINVAAGPFGFTLTLLMSDPTTQDDAPGVPRVVGRLRMSPELAGALARTLTEAHVDHRRRLAEMEKPNGGS
jgi:hypothetical protein